MIKRERRKAKLSLELANDDDIIEIKLINCEQSEMGENFH
jgi:hypothetical protein